MASGGGGGGPSCHRSVEDGEGGAGGGDGSRRLRTPSPPMAASQKAWTSQGTTSSFEDPMSHYRSDLDGYVRFMYSNSVVVLGSVVLECSLNRFFNLTLGFRPSSGIFTFSSMEQSLCKKE